MNELEQGLYTALTALLAGSPPAGGVHVHPAPQAVGLPVVTFQKQAVPAPDRTFGAPATQGGKLAWRTFVYLIRAISQNDRKPALTLHDTIVNALGVTTPLTVTGWNVMLCQYEGDIEFAESVGGETYHHVGGLYRVQLTP